ncbi:hypothetical protein [Xylanimonas sp. McL0601]|uniref:hypothetical protein n=1 Tax=Xylanimonas sp. McL0601 TaxID=3414739 RepID=UPI003CE89B5A
MRSWSRVVQRRRSKTFFCSEARFETELRAAGAEVTGVRYMGTIHDFVMLNTLHEP